MLVEVVDQRIAQRGTHFVDVVDVFAVHFEGDLVGADGQTGMEVVTLLVGLHLIVALNVFAVDFDQGALQRLTVFALHIPLQRSCRLRETGEGEKQDSQGGQGQARSDGGAS